MTVIFEPAVAIAVSRCLTARSIDEGGRTAVHPRECGWCSYPLPELVSMVEGFNAWAGHDMRSNSYAKHEARVFDDLPRDEQQRLILEAQDFPELRPTPVPAPPAPAPEPSDDDDEWSLL